MDSQENWSLRTQEGVLVIENDKIIQRTSKENLDEILRKYWILTVIHTQSDSFSLGLTSELRKWFIYRTLSFLCQVHFEKKQIFEILSFSSSGPGPFQATSWSIPFILLTIQRTLYSQTASHKTPRPCPNQVTTRLGSIRSSPRYGLSTPYRLLIRNSASPFLLINLWEHFQDYTFSIKIQN